MRVSRLGTAILGVAVVAACGGGGDGGGTPTGPSDSTRPPSGTVPVFMQIIDPSPSLASFSFTLNGQTVTAAGDHRFNVPSGSHEVTGRLTPGSVPAGIGIRLHGLEGIDVARFGGPQKGTIQHLEGPTATVSECNVLYLIEFGSPVQPYTVRFQFTANGSIPIDRRC